MYTCLRPYMDGFHGVWLHFWRQDLGSLFSGAVCKIQANERLSAMLSLYH